MDNESYCKGCIYYRYTSSSNTGLRACHYMLITGNSRMKICNPGKECTVRKEEGNEKELTPDHNSCHSTDSLQPG